MNINVKHDSLKEILLTKVFAIKYTVFEFLSVQDFHAYLFSNGMLKNMSCSMHECVCVHCMYNICI